MSNCVPLFSNKIKLSKLKRKEKTVVIFIYTLYTQHWIMIETPLEILCFLQTELCT